MTPENRYICGVVRKISLSGFEITDESPLDLEIPEMHVRVARNVLRRLQERIDPGSYVDISRSGAMSVETPTPSLARH